MRHVYTGANHMFNFKSPIKSKARILAAIIFSLISSTSWATSYYVDATSGNDNHTGLSPTTAWRSITKVNLSSFKPGDQIRFERGEIWREHLSIPSSGSSGRHIIFGAYGSGSKPVISGADIFDNWTSEVIGSFTVYYASAATEAKQLLEDGSRLKQVSTKNALTDGTWWQDSTNHKIFIRTASDDHPSGHTIEGSQRKYGISIQNRSYITIENIQLESTNEKGLDIFAPNLSMNAIIIRNVVSSHNYIAGLRATGMNNFTINNVIIENSVFNYNGADGILITNNCNNFTIRNNTVHNNCLLVDPNEPELNWTGGIRAISPSVNHVIYEDNVVYANGKLNGNPVVGGARGYGIWFDTIGSDGIMRRNKVYDNNESGIRVEATSDAEVYYNIAYNNNSGITLARQVHRNKLYNNVVYNNAISGIRIVGDSPARPNNVTGNLVMNNIATGNKFELDARFGGENDGTAGYGNVYEYNCFGVQSDKFIMWVNMQYIDTYDALESAYGANTHSIQSDPLFTDPDNFKFTLQLGSPAINVGKDVGLIQDFNKTSIPQFEKTDIGAFEYKISPPENIRSLLP